MPQYSAGQVKIESGVAGSSSMQVLQCITKVDISTQIPHTNVNVLNRGKPLADRPVINYIPADITIEGYKKDSRLEQCLALVNATGVVANITDTKAATVTYGQRNLQVYFAPTSSTSYNGLYDLKSGVLNSYSLQGSVNEPVRMSVSLQCLDMSGSINTTARDTTNYAANPIKPENVQLTGIQFTGYGLTGTNIQSFSFGLAFSRVGVQQLGLRFPVERPLTDVVANLQVQGFFEGLNSSMTGLSQYYPGSPSVGTVGLTMTPSCATDTSTSTSTITIINPYIENFSINGQVGGFTTFSISLSAPIGPNPNETGDGSVVIFS